MTANTSPPALNEVDAGVEDSQVQAACAISHVTVAVISPSSQPGCVIRGVIGVWYVTLGLFAVAVEVEVDWQKQNKEKQKQRAQWECNFKFN